jgi:hypothetical protein
VIDLGLRLADVRVWNLQAEDVHYQSDPAPNLRENGATEEEIDFLCSRRAWRSYYGQRVELNAFLCADLITWIEAKLAECGVQKVVPSQKTLEAAYRRALEAQHIKEHLDEIRKQAREFVAGGDVPLDLVQAVAQRLREQPALSWDEVVAEMAVEAL